jgi:hypothetical protein
MNNVLGETAEEIEETSEEDVDTIKTSQPSE